MDLGISGRRAIVTGASRGIGAAVTLRLVGEGVAVSCCARNGDDLLILEEKAAGGAGRLFTMSADLSVEESVTDFLRFSEDRLGTVDILVNNVGVPFRRDFTTMSAQDWSDGLRLNLMVAVRATSAVLPGMCDRRWGRVVMVTSGGAKYPTASRVDYSAAKAAMWSMTKALARDMGRHGVLVNAVAPGMIMTEMWEKQALEVGRATGARPEEVLTERGSRVPVRRLGTADEVADVIVFLASERASYVNGASIDVDGGLGPAI